MPGSSAARQLRNRLARFHLDGLTAVAAGGLQHRLIYQTLGYRYTVDGVRYRGVLAAFADPTLGRTLGTVQFTDTRAHLDAGITVFGHAVGWAHVAG